MKTSLPEPSGGRACRQCNKPIPPEKRSNAVFCSPECRANAASKRYVTRHPNRRAATMRKARAKHPETFSRVKEEAKRKQRERLPQGLLSYKKKMVAAAKSRSAKKGLPFDITHADIELPDTCPVLGTEMVLGGTVEQRDLAPSLDRVMPALGYVRGNIIVISNRANRIKNNATIQELRQVADFFEAHIADAWMQPKEPST